MIRSARKHPKHPNLLDLARELAEGAGAGAGLSPEERLSSLLVLLSGTPIAPYKLGDPKLAPHLERASGVRRRSNHRSDTELRPPTGPPSTATIKPFLARARRRLAEARAALPQDPGRSVAKARAAHRLVARVGRRYGPKNTDRQLAAAATAYISNGYRVEGRLTEARAQMDVARTLERYASDPHPFLSAEIHRLEAVLERDARNLSRAIALYGKAILDYRRAQDLVSVAQVNLGLCAVYGAQGLFHRAEACCRSVVDLVSLEEPFLLGAHLNLNLYLVEQGRATEARENLAKLEDAFGRHAHLFYLRVRHRWLKGRIAGVLKEWEASEAGLREAFEEMVAHGNPYDAALVSLDLADLYRRSRQWDRLVPHAEELIPVLEGLEELHAEAARAVALYQEAMARGEYKSGFGNKLHRYLLLARNDRGYRFEK